MTGAVELPRLTGIVEGPFGRRAIFAGADGDKSIVVSIGDTVGEFRVLRIGDGEVALRGPDELRRLRPAFVNAEATEASQAMAPFVPGGLPPGILPEDIKPAQPVRRR